MSADEDLLHCAVCLFSGTAAQVSERQSRVHPVDWATAAVDAALNAVGPPPGAEIREACALLPNPSENRG